MTEREHVYKPLKEHLQEVDWCRLENMVGSGMPDINGCSPDGVASWVETKIIHGNKITFQRFQPAWLLKRTIRHDRVFVLARKLDTFYLWAGRSLIKLLQEAEPRDKTLIVDYRASSGWVFPTPVDWGRVNHILFETPMGAF